jgi:hypothetical protein
MPSPHFWIPADLTRIEPVVKGGGGTSFVRDDPAAHSRALREAFDRSAATFANRRDFDVATDLIVQITTAPGWSIGKERQHLRNLGFEVVALSEQQPNVAIAKISRETLPKFSKKLNRYADTSKHIGKGNFGAIEAITPVGVERKVEPSLARADAAMEVSCLITLFGALPAEMKQIVASRLASDLREMGKRDVTIHSFANGSVGIAADLTPPEMERISEQYMFVRAIESNAEVVVEAAIQADPIPQIIQIDRVKCQTPVAVVDSGVNAACSLLAGLVVRSINELPPGSAGPHMAHGTFVASRVVYGDDITGVLNRRARPWCPIIDVQVTGDDGLGNRLSQHAAQLGEILQRVVPALADQTKVFNLSLGIAPIADGRYSVLARLIDFLSREHKVLFVIAAGNVNDPVAEPPRHYLAPNTRVLFPAESLLSLTVGSIAKYSEPNCVAQEQEVAPYSRRGPGADRALKPEVAMHGGNVLWSGQGWTTTPRVAAYGLGRLGTHLEYSVGTSYSAPLVSQYAARLFDAYPDASPNLVRALLCHFTTQVVCPAPGLPLEDHHFCGFGEPNIDSAMFAGDHGAAYLFSGEVPKDHYMFIPFYVPEALANTNGTRLTIRGTVVFDPPVSLDDSVDYSLCRIAGLLRKRGAEGLRDVSIGGEENDTLYPWNPLFQFRHSFRRGYAAGDWELRLRLMTRGTLPDNFAQSFSVVIEVIDEAKRLNVRDAIVAEVQAYAPIVLRLAA